MADAILFNLDGSVTVPLTKGHSTTLDREDYETFFRPNDGGPTVRWCLVTYRGDHRYAYRKERMPDGTVRTAHLHRDILAAPRGIDVDHINGDGLDNRRNNLRLASRTQNNANRRRSVTAASVYKGVHWDKITKRWRAQIVCRDRKYHLGRFDHEDDAGRAYNAAATRLFGAFARLNEIR